MAPFRNITAELTMICLMMMAAHAQTVSAGVTVETDRSRIETSNRGVVVQTNSPLINRPPLNSAHPLLRRSQSDRLPSLPPVPLPSNAGSTSIQCANGQTVTSRQRIYTNQSRSRITQTQQQTTATCQ